jgi:hypothetical protein
MCAQVITWLQTLTVASVLVNMFLAAIIGVLVVELRKEMNARRPPEKMPAKLAEPVKRVPWLKGPAAIAAHLSGGKP